MHDGENMQTAQKGPDDQATLNQTMHVRVVVLDSKFNTIHHLSSYLSLYWMADVLSIFSEIQLWSEAVSSLMVCLDQVYLETGQVQVPVQIFAGLM